MLENRIGIYNFHEIQLPGLIAFDTIALHEITADGAVGSKVKKQNGKLVIFPDDPGIMSIDFGPKGIQINGSAIPHLNITVQPNEIKHTEEIFSEAENGFIQSYSITHSLDGTDNSGSRFSWNRYRIEKYELSRTARLVSVRNHLLKDMLKTRRVPSMIENQLGLLNAALGQLPSEERMIHSIELPVTEPIDEAIVRELTPEGVADLHTLTDSIDIYYREVDDAFQIFWETHDNLSSYPYAITFLERMLERVPEEILISSQGKELGRDVELEDPGTMEASLYLTYSALRSYKKIVNSLTGDLTRIYNALSEGESAILLPSE